MQVATTGAVLRNTNYRPCASPPPIEQFHNVPDGFVRPQTTLDGGEGKRTLFF